MNVGRWIRLGCITALWVVLCWFVIAGSRPFTLWTLFVIIASGIIVFVPIYKKYMRNANRKDSSGH